MYVLVTYKNEEDQMKNEDARVVTFYSYTLDAQGQLTRVWPKIKLFKAFAVVVVTCKNEEDPFKDEGARMVTTDLQLQVYADLSRPSGVFNFTV